MITFLNTEEHRLDLIVLRGLGDTPENFKRSDVKVLAVNSHNKIPLTCEIKDIYDNHLYCWLPSGMESGVYALEVYWTKCRGGLKVNNLNSSVYMYARTPECFAVTSNYDESTNLADNQAVEIKMRSASFGYDGLGAYELAVLRGDYSGSEEEWTDLHLGMRLDTDKDILTLKGIQYQLTRATGSSGGGTTPTVETPNFWVGYGVQYSKVEAFTSAEQFIAIAKGSGKNSKTFNLSVDNANRDVIWILYPEGQEMHITTMQNGINITESPSSFNLGEYEYNGETYSAEAIYMTGQATITQVTIS